MTRKVNIVLDEGAVLPKYGTDFSAGADLYALTEYPIVIEPGETVLIHTGVKMEIPNECVGLVFARSGLATKQGLAPANKVGVIDSDYRGEIMVALFNHSHNPKIVSSGDRIAQIVIIPYLQAGWNVVEELSDTVRGDGGFGSSGMR